MRIPPPESLRIVPEDLLEDVRERLERRLGGRYGDPDPTDPAWLVLEEAAWMIGLLSEQLESYPLSSIQQFVHLLGAELTPARPALGVVAVHPDVGGDLTVSRTNPSRWQFFAAQNEERDLIEFAPLEASVPLRPAQVRSLVTVVGGELWCLGEPGKAGIDGCGIEAGEARRSRAFDGERIDYRVSGANPEGLQALLEKAVAAFADQAPGWLALEVREAPGGAVLRARVALHKAFDEAAPGGLTTGEELIGRWRPLPGSTWTPAARIRDHRAVPPVLRGAPPMPGPEDGTILLGGIPAGLEVDGLLERSSAPLPDPVVDAIWTAVALGETKLATLRPVVRRVVEPREDPAEPTWVEAVLAGSAWGRIRNGGSTVVHVQLDEPARARETLRLAWVRAPQAGHGRVEAATLESGQLSEPIKGSVIWTLPLPSPGAGRGLAECLAAEIPLPLGARHVLFFLPGEVQQVFVNPLLVVNAPVVIDRRSATVARAVGETWTLQHEDIVTPGVMDSFSGEPLDGSLQRLLSALPLARFEVERGNPINDFSGVAIDASRGEVTVNAPDALGRIQRLRRGAEVQMSWYRRTDGAAALVEAGEIEFVEQPPRTRPSIAAVRNPLPTGFGRDRETDAACQQRVFGPSGETPALATDWEHALRGRLGDRAAGWIIRCWTYTERSFFTSRLWPLHLEHATPELVDLQRLLHAAGPETLLFAVGPAEGELSRRDVDLAQLVADGLVGDVRRRLPAIRSAVVCRLWPLQHHGTAEPGAASLPTHDLTGLEGTLVDAEGRVADAPAHGMLLNALVMPAGGPR